jgi:hypothetical protein
MRMSSELGRIRDQVGERHEGARLDGYGMLAVALALVARILRG